MQFENSAQNGLHVEIEVLYIDLVSIDYYQIKLQPKVFCS
jgi:hypothetical protein